MTKLTTEEFQLWANFIFQFSGIVIGEGKNYLIENRLRELLSETNSKSFSELYYKCRYSKDDSIRKSVIDRISTQETSFFRDPPVYISLKNLIVEEIVPMKRAEAVGMDKPILRVWSVACSTGQEPYSLAIVLKETIPDLDRWKLTIMATDLAENALQKARLGKYSKFEVKRGLDPLQVKKYFSEQPDGLLQISDRLRSLVTFEKVNLVKDDFGRFGVFDLVFCRNVAIYFDRPTKKKLFEKLDAALSRKGYLLLGTSETITQSEVLFQPCLWRNCMYYRKSDSDGAA